MVILRLISPLYLTSTKINILLIDPSPNENYDVLFASHKTTENISIFMAFTKNSHLKRVKIFKIDRLKFPKGLISNKKKQKSFLQK